MRPGPGCGHFGFCIDGTAIPSPPPRQRRARRNRKPISVRQGGLEYFSSMEISLSTKSCLSPLIATAENSAVEPVATATAQNIFSEFSTTTAGCYLN
jgi:hypothetical protein